MIKQISERSNNICELCHSARAIQVHHLKYRSSGGNNDLDNLIHLCLKCHYEMHNNPEYIKRFKNKKFSELLGDKIEY